MARTLITLNTIPQNGLSLDAVTFTNGDSANDMYFVNDGNTILIAKNADAGAHAGSLVSVADQFGRTGDDPFSIAAGATLVAGPFPASLWNQAGGIMHVDFTTATSVTIAAVKLPVK